MNDQTHRPDVTSRIFFRFSPLKYLCVGHEGLQKPHNRTRNRRPEKPYTDDYNHVGGKRIKNTVTISATVSERKKPRPEDQQLGGQIFSVYYPIIIKEV